MKKIILPILAVSIVASAAFSPVLSYAEELITASEETGTTEVTETTDTSAPTESTTDSSTGTTDSTTESSSSAPEETTGSTGSEVPTVVEPSVPAPTPEVVAPAPQTPVVEGPATVQEAQAATSVISSEAISVVKDQSTEAFVRRIGEKARKIGQEYDLYASVMIAQAILETGAGSSSLSLDPYFNLFGIKGDYEGQSVILPTFEDDGTGNLYQIDAAFKHYPDYTESFKDYAKLMTEGTEWSPSIYSGTWKSNTASYQEATKALTGVYATDTQYDQKLNAFIEEYQLTEYDKAEPSTSLSGIILADSHPDSDFKEYAGESYAGAEYYAVGNCTQYVYNRITQLDGVVEVNMGNGMDWGTTGKAYGYEVTHEPKAGTAVSFQPGVLDADGTYGHVAFVEHIYEDGSILISEMNVAGLGVVSFRVIDAQTANILTYVTPK